MSDAVNNPPHYSSYKIEVLEAIEAWHLGFNLGNVVKYCVRAGRKSDDRIQDLKKACFYLQREIELLEAVREEREPIKPNQMKDKK